jgi:magnesium-transporting ATPase (P-type)
MVLDNTRCRFLQGLKDESRSKYQLLLRCVLILTSVVPPELPMQMGLAVNTALMALHKVCIYYPICCAFVNSACHVNSHYRLFASSKSFLIRTRHL